MVKTDAPALLRAALAAPRWQPQVVALSGNTDCYQPVERQLRLTRGCLEVFAEFRNPVSVITKSALVTRDADLLAELAADGAAQVNVSITTLDPRARAPHGAARGDARAAPARRSPPSAAAGVPVGVMVAPVIPGLNDHEIPAVLERAAAAGARSAALGDAAPGDAARPALRRLARAPLSRPRRARPRPHARLSRRRPQRSALRPPHARRGPVRRPDRATCSRSRRAAAASTGRLPPLRQRRLPRSAPRLATNCVCSERPRRTWQRWRAPLPRRRTTGAGSGDGRAGTALQRCSWLAQPRRWVMVNFLPKLTSRWYVCRYPPNVRGIHASIICLDQWSRLARRLRWRRRWRRQPAAEPSRRRSTSIPTGSDDNDGLAPDRPFRTLVRAVDGLLAGDVVYVAPGTYPVCRRHPASRSRRRWRRSTTSTAPRRSRLDHRRSHRGEDRHQSRRGDRRRPERRAIGLRLSRATHMIIDGFRIIRAKGNNGGGDPGTQQLGRRDGPQLHHHRQRRRHPGGELERPADLQQPHLRQRQPRHPHQQRLGARAHHQQHHRRQRNRGIAIGGANAENVAPTGATLRNNIIQNNSNVSISIEDGPPSALESATAATSTSSSTPASPTRRRPTGRRPSSAPTTSTSTRSSSTSADGDFHLRASSPAINAGTGNIGDALLATLFDRTDHRRRRARRSAGRHRLPLSRPSDGVRRVSAVDRCAAWRRADAPRSATRPPEHLLVALLAHHGAVVAQVFEVGERLEGRRELVGERAVAVEGEGAAGDVVGVVRRGGGRCRGCPAAAPGGAG